MANIITLTRLILVPLFLLIEPFTTSFYLLYVFCGISDILDGYIARKTRSESPLGARLDSIADLGMVIILLTVLIPIIKLDMHYLIWMYAIILIRFISMIIVFLKYKQFGILHTYANKMTGLLLFVFPIIYHVSWFDFYAILLCLIATLSAVEEVIIHFTSQIFISDTKSVFK